MDVERVVANMRETAVREFADDGDTVDLDLARSVTKEIGRIVHPHIIIVAFDVDETVYVMRARDHEWGMEVIEP